MSGRNGGEQPEEGGFPKGDDRRRSPFMGEGEKRGGVLRYRGKEVTSKQRGFPMEKEKRLFLYISEGSAPANQKGESMLTKEKALSAT